MIHCCCFFIIACLYYKMYKFFRNKITKYKIKRAQCKVNLKINCNINKKK